MLRRILVVTFAASCLLGGPLVRAGEPARESDGRLGKAFRTEKNGWIFVHLEGSPDEVGYQHGALLAGEIADLIRVCKPFLEKTTRRDWNFYRQTAGFRGHQT
jgi:hypothetical protein